MEDRLQASHNSRRKFQTRAYAAALIVVLLACLVLIIGVAMKPPVACLPGCGCVQQPDWGAAIVSKMSNAITAFGVLLGILGGWVGGTLWRGANDAKVDGPPK